MNGRTSLLGGLMITGLAAMTCACGNDQSAIVCNGRAVDLERLAASVAAMDPERTEEDRITAVIRHELVRCAVLAEPPTADERSLLERMDRNRRAQQCVDVELKQRVAGRRDLVGEARTRFEADPASFLRPESFRLQIIFIPSTEVGGKDLARRILNEVRVAPERFADLAIQHSSSETAAAGGITNPMPGTTVHQSMRDAIQRHHESGDPFLVTTDTGWFVAKVLEYWPPLTGTWQEMAPRVTEQIAREHASDEIRLLIESFEATHDVEVATELFNQPVVPVTRTALTIDRRQYAISDLMPFQEGEQVIPGPVVKSAVNSFRRWYEPALELGCIDGVSEFDDDQLFGVRLGPRLTRFADAHMDDDIRRFVDLHADALVDNREFTFDLWLFPVQSSSPFSDLQLYRAALERIEGGGTAPDSVLFFEHVKASGAHVTAYEPALRKMLENLTPDVISEPLLSRRLGAFVATRLRDRTGPRQLSLDDPTDRLRIVEAYVANSTDQVMDAFATHLETECRIRPDLNAAVARRIRMPSEPPAP
jgi:hypothetical protein